MSTVSHQAEHEVIERSRAVALEVCRELDPDVRVTVNEALDICLSWGGHERHIELTADRLATLPRVREYLEREIKAAVNTLHRQTPVPDNAQAAPPRSGEGASPTATGASPVQQSMSPADREVLDRTMELARHIVGEIDPTAGVSFEEYVWHGDPTLDITVTLHGRQQHLEVTASRARIILPDYEWELRQHNLEDELLYHELEEVVHDLHRRT
jgi:hypothetical protein